MIVSSVSVRHLIPVINSPVDTMSAFPRGPMSSVLQKSVRAVLRGWRWSLRGMRAMMVRMWRGFVSSAGVVRGCCVSKRYRPSLLPLPAGARDRLIQ